MLQRNTIPTRVHKGTSNLVRVRIGGSYGLVASCLQSVDCFLPALASGKVQDQQVIRRWSAPDTVTSFMCELEVIRRAGTPGRDAVEPIVILECIEHNQSEPLRVKAHNGVELICRARNAHSHVVIQASAPLYFTGRGNQSTMNNIAPTVVFDMKLALDTHQDVALDAPVIGEVPQRTSAAKTASKKIAHGFTNNINSLYSVF